MTLSGRSELFAEGAFQAGVFTGEGAEGVFDGGGAFAAGFIKTLLGTLAGGIGSAGGDGGINAAVFFAACFLVGGDLLFEPLLLFSETEGFCLGEVGGGDDVFDGGLDV